MVLVVTVGGTLTTEVVTLHTTSETFTLRNGGDVNHLALLESVGDNLLSDFVSRNVIQAKLYELLARSNSCGVEVSELTLGESRHATGTPGHLER